MTQPDLDPDEYPPIDPREPAPDDAGELLSDASEPLPEAPVEPMPDEHRGGFLAIRAEAAVELASRLRQRGVHCDARGDVLRFGPAPYLRDDQLTDAIRVLGEVLRVP